MSAAIAAGAAARDEAASYPDAAIAALRDAGLLQAALPVRHDGRGWGSEPEGAADIAGILIDIGRADLVAGRLYEAHVNAVRLIARLGEPVDIGSVASDVASGHLFALWVTDPAEGGLAVDRNGVLSGGKSYCSGAGHATRALVTAVDPDGRTRLFVVHTEAARVAPLPFALSGMRGSATGRVAFDGLRVAQAIGGADDYLREPDFSTGAWRSSAVACGGALALAGETVAQLAARGRAGDPHQAARIGQMLINAETARLWVGRAAIRGDDADEDPAGAIAYVGLARIAVEAACLDSIRLAQRSLGLSSLTRPNPVERIMRDLATYLRQPAGDQVLTEAAAIGLDAIERARG